MKYFARILALSALSAGGCAQIDKEAISTSQNAALGLTGTQPGIYLANTITSAPGQTGTGFYDTARATNGIRGGGNDAGSTDVFSLDNVGFNSNLSTELVLSWGTSKVLNGTGIDFIVFENPFNQSGNPATRFMDAVIVEVSNDNLNFCGFAPNYTATTETSYSNNPAHWQNFAGVQPVLYNVDSNNLTAAQLFQDNNADRVPDLAGGDGFDLDYLSADNIFGTGCSATLRDDLKTNGFRYLRLVPANRRTNPDTSAAFVVDAAANGPDIDGVAARYTQ